ncbi:MAG: porin, partial [Hyphomonadaceae bacterium]
MKAFRTRAAILMGASWLALTGVAAAQGAAPAAAAEDPRDALIRDLAARIEALEAQIGDLAERSAASTDDVRRIVNEAPQVTINNARPQIASADGSFRTAFRGLFQLDAASYLQDDPSGPDNRRAGATTAEGPAARDLSSGLNFRRARIGLEGTAFRDWNYAITYEAGGSGTEASSLQQAWIEYAGW